MSPCLLHRRDLARGHCLPVIHLKLCAESGRWRMNNSPSPKFLPSCSPLISPSPPWDSSSTLRRVYGWPLLECLRTWDEDDSETLDKNWKPIAFSAAGRQTGKSKSHLHLHSAYLFFLVPPHWQNLIWNWQENLVCAITKQTVEG